jgi:hypothetical protein
MDGGELDVSVGSVSGGIDLYSLRALQNGRRKSDGRELEGGHEYLANCFKIHTNVLFSRL